MSRALRQKLLRELTSQRGGKTSAAVRRKREQWVKDYFDNGQIRLTKTHWDNTYSEAVSRVKGQVRSITPRPMTASEWTSIFKFVNTSLRQKVKSDICEIKDIKKQGDTITIVYRRGPKRIGAGNQGTIDLERYITSRLREVMEDFFKTGKFKKLIKDTIILAKSGNQGMTISHGDTIEPNFGSSGTDSRLSTQSQIEGTLVNGNQTAPGAKGTLISKQMIVAIAQECEKNFAKTNFFTSVFEAIDAKWDDMFGYSSNVVSSDTKQGVRDTVSLSAELIPTRILRLQKLNRGVFDKAISSELQNYLANDEYFASEVVRLNPRHHNQIAMLTTGSKTTQERIEKSAIKLAEVEILESLKSKTVRKRKKNSSKQKRGGSKTKYKGTNSSSRKQTTKNASTKRGRPSKASQAIGGNPIALKELINAQLPKELLKNMQLPRLRNRTGRFRNSAEVTNVLMGPRGGTHIEYTYMKNPYQTFEPGGRQGSTNRDPRRLIGGTVREIAQEIMGRRFIKVRSV